MGMEWMPASSRPREKLLAHGARALSDAELLALLLRTGTTGKGVLTLADEVLQNHGGVAGLLQAAAAPVGGLRASARPSGPNWVRYLS